MGVSEEANIGDRVLVVGSGGREHALVWKLSQSSRIQVVRVAPGNDGMPYPRYSVDVNDFHGLLQHAREDGIHLTVVGPDEPLVGGIVDEFRAAGFRIVGPTGAAAKLEGSKSFAKLLMRRRRIPTAEFTLVYHPDEAIRQARIMFGLPVVLKADGLCAGKGAFVCYTTTQLEEAVHKLFNNPGLVEEGQCALVEQFLTGWEVSVFVLVDTSGNFVWLGEACDYKQLYEGKGAPNTGGMGAYSPVPELTEAHRRFIEHRIIRPALDEMKRLGFSYSGVLYLGLMVTPSGLYVIEFNCRFGDPEAQVILPRIKSDLYELLLASTEENGLVGKRVEFSPDHCVGVVMAVPGYPSKPKLDVKIQGVDLAEKMGTLVFRGTTRAATVVGRGATRVEARDHAYDEGVASLIFPGAVWRDNIAEERISN